MAERLQKLLARAGVGSRRHNESLIREGRVTVNGRIATLGERADPSVDRVEVDGQPVELARSVYIMLNKPRNVLSSTEDELGQERRTVRDLVDVPGHLYPVGRLDRNSLGLILLTNDGALAHQLSHPRFEHKKTYRVKVEGRPNGETLRRWRQGVELDGKKTLPAQISVESETADSTWLRIVLREGRKRQIRRVAALLGHPVQALIRTRLGPLALSDLPLGQWRHLTPGEVAALRRAVRRGRKAASRRSSNRRPGAAKDAGQRRDRRRGRSRRERDAR